MVNEKEYQKLKEIIQKAVPGIMDLKFGCEVEYEKQPMRAIYNGIVTHSPDEFNAMVLHNGLVPDFIVVKKDIRKIFGRPITFADILLALNYYHIQFSLRNYFPNSVQFEGGGKLLCIWNLTKNLDGQKDQAKQFFINLINNYDKKI